MSAIRLLSVRTIALMALIVSPGRAQDSPKRDPQPSGKTPPAAGTKETRLAWNLRTHVGEYERIGQKSEKWDAPAKKALEFHARAHGKEAGAAPLPDADVKYVAPLKEAIKAGCTDPLVRFLHLRMVHRTVTKSPSVAAEYRNVARDMAASGYSDFHKFHAAVRAAEMLNSANTESKVPREVYDFRKTAATHLKKLVEDPGTPVEEIFECFDRLFVVTDRNPKQLESFFQSMEPALMKNWPESHVPLLIQGKFAIKWAWDARGGGYADKVTEEGWRLFIERLNLAQKSLEDAWNMNPKDPRVANEMITLELGQGKGRQRMETWFERAMDLDPNNYDACNKKRYYLEPKWYGSPQDMIAFGRECVASKKWGGSVPLTLVEVHLSLVKYLEDPGLQDKYWQQPGVWNDIKASYEKYALLNPKSSIIKPRLVHYAYKCNQWDELDQLLRQIGPVTDYAPFGGQIEYVMMAKAAREHATQK